MSKLIETLIKNRPDLEFYKIILNVQLIGKSENALHCRCGDVKIWIPIKYFHEDTELNMESKIGEIGIISIPDEFAKQNKLYTNIARDYNYGI